MKSVMGKPAVTTSRAALVVAGAVSRKGKLARIGSAFEAYRLSRNIRQEDLADQAGIARSTLARLEKDGTATLETTLRVLEALGLADRLELLIPEVRESPLDPLSGSRQRATREGALTLKTEGYRIRNTTPPRAKPEDKSSKDTVKKHIPKSSLKANFAQGLVQSLAARPLTQSGKEATKGGKRRPALDGYRPKWGDEK